MARIMRRDQILEALFSIKNCDITGPSRVPSSSTLLSILSMQIWISLRQRNPFLTEIKLYYDNKLNFFFHVSVQKIKNNTIISSVHYPGRFNNLKT